MAVTHMAATTVDGGLGRKGEELYRLVISGIGSLQPIDYSAGAVKADTAPLSIKSAMAAHQESQR
jgi:hypothetical protein